MNKLDIDDILTKVLNMGVDLGQEGGGLEPWDMMSPAQAKQALYHRLAAEAEPLGLWGNDLAIPISRLKAIMEIKE